MAVAVAVSVRDGKQGGERRLVFARRLRAISSTFSRTNWFCISGKCGSTNEAFSRAFRNSDVYRKLSWKSCLMFHQSGILRGSRASDTTAITTTMLHLCSAPCKALRFAPSAHARGLRALTVPARR
jgi:hypothetical protein